MTMQDPISDLLTRIRNAFQAGHEKLELPSSNMKVRISEVLKESGYIQSYEEIEIRKNIRILKIKLRYYREKPSIKTIFRVSRPGLRNYIAADDIKPFYQGMGVSVISTSLGLKTDKQCRAENIGGEVLFRVF